MKIDTYSIGDLKQVMVDGWPWRTGTIPISPHRIVSQIHNPRAVDTDTALIVATDCGRVVGYIGMLPDTTGGDAPQPFSWLTTWWAEPQSKTHTLGAVLLMRAIKATDNRVAAADYSEKSWRVYKASRQFVPFCELRGVAVRLLLDRPDESRPQWVKMLMKTASFTLDPVLQCRICVARSNIGRKFAGVSFEYVFHVDNEIEALINRERRPELTYRGRAELNWIVRYPWVVESTVPDHFTCSYHFCITSHRHTIFMTKVRDGTHKLIGFLMLHIRGNTLSVPYAFFAAENADTLVQVILHHAYHGRISRLSLYEPRLVTALDQVRLACLYRKPIVRRVIISRPLQQHVLSNSLLHQGDSDGAFY